MTMIQSEWEEKHHGRARAKEEYGHNSEKEESRQSHQPVNQRDAYVERATAFA